MSKTLSVSAIQNGTVIDHIPAGQALRIIQLLRLLEKKYQITVGLNLPSKRLKLKDLIKIENHTLTDDDANEITILAPEATINIIKGGDVKDKKKISLPPTAKGVFICPNLVCITRTEPIESFFMIEEIGGKIKLICRYCEKTFDKNKVKVKL